MNENSTDPLSDLHAFIPPELEARVVAWVLGEASAFEAEELARRCAEQPELALFKRRIEAVHGLVGHAAKPEAPSLHLSPEKRGKLLQAISAILDPVGPDLASGPNVSAPRAARTQSPALHLLRRRPRRPWVRLRASYGAAAGVLLVIGTIAFLVPQLSRQPDRASDIVRAHERQRQLETQSALISDSERRKSEALARAEVERRRGLPLAPAPDAITIPPTRGMGRSEVPLVANAASPAADEDDNWFGETIVEEPFEVTTEADTAYAAANTLAGTRMQTELRDIGSAVEITNQEFLDDIAATNQPSFKEYTSSGNAEGQASGDRDDFSQTPASPSLHPEDELAMAPNDSASGNAHGLLFGQAPSDGTPNLNSEKRALRPDAPPDLVAMAGVDTPKRGSEGFGFFRRINPPRSEEADLARLKEDLAQPTLDNTPGSGKARNSSSDARLGLSPLVASSERPAKTTATQTGAPDETSTAVEPVSTFSLHVSDVSFRLAQAALARGEVPDPTRIRPEEFYNAFDYGDPAPASAEKIACRIEQAAHPVLPQRNLVRIAMRVPATGRGAGQPLHLTVLLDTSGSMERADRVASVQRALEVLGSLLGANDRVTLIGFARTPRLLADALAGDQAAKLCTLAAQTPAEGGTNLEAALKLAFEKARQGFDAAAQNRVVLITDGAANLGNADPERLAAAIEKARQQGLAFDACGVGTDGLNDTMLEALTRKGDGRYYVLDSPADADAGFARQLAGAFRPAAKNVKVQVRFNPARVAHYRLIGFEQHRLRTEDFRNDRVDAAELAAAEAAVALYQVEVKPDDEGELGDVFVRFRDTATNTMVERSWTMPFAARVRAFDQATPSMQLAGVAALLAEKLHGGAMADLVRLDEFAPVVNALRSHFANNARVQDLVTMFEQARRLVETR